MVLQEVSRWATAPVSPEGEAGPEEVVADFLPALLDALVAAGSPYDVHAVNHNFAGGLPVDGSWTSIQGANVVLVRRDGLFTVTAERTGTFDSDFAVTDRSGLRTAYANLLRDRLSLSSEPVALAPPPIPADSPTSGTIPGHGGCLMCGLAVVTVPAVAVARAGGRDLAAREVWTPRRISTETLGGRRSPTPLAGHLCPDCNAAAGVRPAHNAFVVPLRSLAARVLVIHAPAQSSSRARRPRYGRLAAPRILPRMRFIGLLGRSPLAAAR